MIAFTDSPTLDELRRQLDSLFADETDPLANMSNMASLLFHALPNLNWCGFYLRHASTLVLGPFQGKPACVRIAVGNGVCGSAVVQNETLVVDDVHAFPGHIACDAASRSEIVVPMRYHGAIIGVCDVDSPIVKRFDRELKNFLEDGVRLLIERCAGWERLVNLTFER